MKDDRYSPREAHLVKAKEAAEECEKMLSITLNSIGDGVISTDLDGCVVSMNPVAEKLCGCKNQEACRLPLSGCESRF